MNLVGNALKFTANGSMEVRYAVETSDDTHSFLRFSVTDTGIGLSSEQQHKLFDKFTQADSSTTRKFGDTGLGLSICKQLVKLMGGEIGVESEAGKGATFWFTLNLANTDTKAAPRLTTDLQAPRSTGKAANGLPQFRARVLVVEDNVTNQAVARGTLKKFGIDIDISSNGQEAVTRLEAEAYDLVFMDCHMPVMDGYSATRLIRDPQSKVLNHAIPIIAMTANAMRGDRNKCIEAGMDGYVAKPVDPAKLCKQLEQWLPDNCQPATAEQTVPAGAEQVQAGAPGPGDASHAAKVVVFDHAEIKKRLMGDADLMQTVCDAFLADMPQQMDSLKAHLEAEDVEGAIIRMHTIKGAAANVGGLALSALAAELEIAGKAGDMRKIRERLTEVDSQYAKLMTAMQESGACNA